MRLRGNPFLKALDRKIIGALIYILRPFRGKSKIPAQLHSVLLIRLNALGDTLLFLSLARVLKARYPDIRVDFLGTEINSPVLERCQYLDQIHLVELSNLTKHPSRLVTLLWRIRRMRYDVVIDGSQWEHISALLALLSGSKTTIGFDTPGHQSRAVAFQFPVPHQRENHEIDCFLSLLGPLGIVAGPLERRGDYHVFPNDRLRLEQLQMPRAPWIVMHPGCGHRSLRQWSALNYRHLADLLNRRFPQYSIILSGAGIEMDLCREIELGFDYIYNFCDILDFHVLGALLEKASLLICGNTGIMHLGATVGTPLVALHGPAGSRRWGPLSERAVVVQSKKSCAPCLYLGYEYDCDCPDCMEAITVEEVFEACSKILSATVPEVYRAG